MSEPRRWALLLAPLLLAACTCATPDPPPPTPTPTPTSAQEAKDAMSPDEVVARARQDAMQDFSSLYPALPAAWPDAGGKVVFLVYKSEPLPTGMVRYAVYRPTRRVVVSVADGAVEVEHMAGGTKAGEILEVGATVQEGLDAAEAALIDVVAGRKTPTEARDALRGYVTWLEASPIYAQQFEVFASEFVAWLQD